MSEMLRWKIKIKCLVHVLNEELSPQLLRKGVFGVTSRLYLSFGEERGRAKPR